MKIFITLFLFLLSLSTAFGQQTSEQIKAKVKTLKDTNVRRYKINYDKFTDKTSVVYLGDVVSNSLLPGYIIQMIVAFEYKTNTLEENINDFALIFSATGKGWEFVKNQQLYSIVDGDRLEFGRGIYDSEINRTLFGGFNTEESLVFQISRSDLERFANAKNVEMRVGKREFKLKDSAFKGFNNVLILSSK